MIDTVSTAFFLNDAGQMKPITDKGSRQLHTVFVTAPSMAEVQDLLSGIARTELSQYKQVFFVTRLQSKLQPAS